MSKEKDELKDLFEGSFASEQIPFDASNWSEIEKLLDNEKPKRRIAWYWFAAAASLVALVVIPWLFESEKTFVPRNEQHSVSEFEQLNDFDDVSQTTNNESSAAFSDETSPIVTTQVETKSSNDIKPKFFERHELASSDYHSELNLKDEPVKTETEPFASEDRKNTQGANSIISTRSELDEMNLIVFAFENTDATVDSLSSIDPKFERLAETSPWQRYMIFGVTKSQSSGYGFFPSWGQNLGIGLTYKVKDHLYLSAELALARDAVGFKKETQYVHYGLTGSNLNQSIFTSELVYIDVPVLIHYRSNRISIGTGPLFEYLTSVKNNENRSATDFNGNAWSDETLQKGYFKWDQYKRVGLGWQFDANYQMFEQLYFGARSNFGFDASAEKGNLSRNRVGFYLKYML